MSEVKAQTINMEKDISTETLGGKPKISQRQLWHIVIAACVGTLIEWYLICILYFL